MILILKIFCMFVVRDNSNINQDATNIIFKTETKTLGRLTGASPAVLSRHRFGLSRRDLPSLFNQNSFIMRDKNDKISEKEKIALLKAWATFIEPTGKEPIVPKTQDALFKILYFLFYYQWQSKENSNLDVIEASFHIRLLYDFLNDYNNYLTELNQN